MTDKDDGRFKPGDDSRREPGMFKEGIDPRREGTQFGDGNTASLYHGGKSYLNTGRVSSCLPWAEEITKELDGLRVGLIRDLGGEDALTEGQAVLISQIVKLHGYTLLVDRWVLEKGSPFVEIKDRSDKVVDIKMIGPLGAFYLAAHGHVKRTLELLGLHIPRRFETATPLERYMNEHEDTNGKEKG